MNDSLKDGQTSRRNPQRRSGMRRSGAPRRLYRSSDDRILSGVAGGIAEYFDIDPVIVRIALVVLTLAGGAGVIGYIAAWVLLPERDGSVAWAAGSDWVAGRGSRRRVDARQLAAIALVGIGAVMLLNRIGIGIDGGIAWPVALIGGGAAVLWGQRNRSGEDDPEHPDTPAGGTRQAGPDQSDGPGSSGGGSGGPGGPTGADGPFGPGSGGGAVATVPRPATDLVLAGPDPIVIEPMSERSTGWDGTWREEARPSGPDPGGPTGATAGAGAHDDEWDRRRRPRRDSRRRARRAGRTPFARAALGLFVALVGVVILATRLGAFDRSADRRVDGAMALLLIALGAVLTLGAWLGRPRGFIAVGVLLGALLIASSTFDVSWRGGFGDRLVTATGAGIQPDYRLTAGALHLDLSRVDMRRQRVRVTTEVSLGRLLVEVPKDVKVVVTAKAGAGTTVLFGIKKDGASLERMATAIGATEAAGTLYLDTRVGLGEIEVARVGHVTTSDWSNR